MLTTHLQSCGDVPAIRAEDAQVGMHRVYNFGEAYEIVAIAPKGKASLLFTIRSPKGEEYTQTTRRDTPIACAIPTERGTLRYVRNA